jgi:preprotein translocase subunit SecY
VPFCTNPECPYRKRAGKPAEYVKGDTECSDCGSPLSGKIIESIDSQEHPQNDFFKRVLYTIAIIIIWKIIALVPAPGINTEAFQDLLSRHRTVPATASTSISVFALGLVPYITAYVIIEILSLFLSPLKSWRKKGYPGRKRLKTVALVATIFLAFFQGYNLALGLEGMSQGELVRTPGLGFRLMMALTLTAGTFMTVFIAELITKRGIGHGISVILLTGIGAKWFLNVNRISQHYASFGIFLILAIITIAFITLIVLFERSQRKLPVIYNDGLEAYLPLKLTTAGIVPAGWAINLLVLLATVFGFIAFPWAQDIARQLLPGGLVHSIALFITIFFFYYLFTALFYNPGKIFTLLKDRNAELVFTKDNKQESIYRSLKIMACIGALYLCGIVLLPDIILSVFGFYVGGIGFIIAVAVVLDLVEEVSKRKKGKSLIKIAEVHDIPVAGLLKSVLEQRGMTCHLRGYYHRALLYFFGPYLEISVLVPEGKVTVAEELIKQYIDPKVIVRYHRA